MDDTQYAAIVRSMIEHEDILRDQGLNWLVASNGLLMAALGFSWGKDSYLIQPIALVGLRHNAALARAPTGPGPYSPRESIPAAWDRAYLDALASKEERPAPK